MKEERSFVYTLILGVCMLLSLLLIGKMLLGHPTSNETEQKTPEPAPQEGKEDTQMGVELTENDLSTLIVQALPFAPEGVAAKISKDGTVAVSASVRKQALVDSGLVEGGMRTALLFLPDECKLYGAWQTAVRDGALTLTCTHAEIAGFAIPEEATAALSDTIAAALNRQLTEWGIALAEIECKDGSIAFRV